MFTSEQEKAVYTLRNQLDDLSEGGMKQALEDSLNSIKSTTLPILSELTGEDRRTTRIFERGNWMALGDEVTSGVPAILPQIRDNSSRLEMAKWIVNDENTLTARVAVNRFWGAIFGKGIVETQEDFGVQGIKPTHPELLDFMAHRLIHDQEWSIKALLKSIVMTDMYRQSSKVTPKLLEVDPYNTLLSRAPRKRLTGEQIRDQALKVSGLLSPKMKGPSVMPYQPDGIWQAVYSARQWKTSEGEDRYRRSVYTYIRRTSPYPSFITFDSPSREFCVNRRISTNTPLQALVVLNDPVYIEAAQALSEKMTAFSEQVEEQIKYGYKMALFEDPSDKALEELLSLYNEIEGDDGKVTVKTVSDDTDQVTGVMVVANVILNLDEFLTRE